MKNLNGLRFGRWIVGERVGTKNGNALWKCVCDCGNIRSVVGISLTKGDSKSCGCWSIDYKRARYTVHGLKKHPLYKIWLGMKNRCYNANKPFPYKDYGGRGIKVCDEWINNFQQFYDDMLEGYKPGLTLERKDVNGNYEKSNCCWITRGDQAKNRRCTIWVETLQGRMCINDAAKIAGISWPAMYTRVKNGWPKENLLIPRSYRS